MRKRYKDAWKTAGLFGLLLALTAHPLTVAADPPTAAGATAGSVAFNFDQVDIRLLVKLVGEITGRQFVIDSSVAGKVTVVTPSRIPREQVYPLFLTILEASGYSIVERGGMGQVVPLPERSMGAAPVLEGDTPPGEQGVITKVIRLQNISAVDLRKVLEPMVRGGKTGALAAFGPTNHLILTDTADNIAFVERLIAALDKPEVTRVAEVVVLQHAPAEDVASQLNAAMKGGESASAGRQASRLPLVGDAATSAASEVIIVPAPHVNGLLLVGQPQQLTALKRIIEQIDVPSRSGSGRLNAVFLKYLSAEQAAKSLNALLTRSAEDRRQRIAIEPSTANNALIVDAAPQDFEYVRALVEQLDTEPQQVLVEVVIAEVGLGKGLDLGVEWSTIEMPGPDKTYPIGRARMGTSDHIMDLVTKGIFPQGLSIGMARGAYTDGDGQLQPSIPLLVTALAQNRGVKILSSVPLWAQNNTEASVSVVDNIPVLKSTIEGGAGTARDVIQNIDRMDVGIKLKLTPHVNPDGQVTMQLNPSIEAIIDEGPSELRYTPTISKREVSTTVTVPDRATIVISGLMREDRIRTIYKIPLLGDIPLLGWLFRHTSDRIQKTNLLIFVTPHVVTDLREALRLRREWENRTQLSVELLTNQPPARSGKGK